VAAISVAVIMLRRRRSNLPIAPSTQPTGKYCISCGAAMPLTAKYCPKCGSSQ
jgi:ribosomal protein L40E